MRVGQRWCLKRADECSAIRKSAFTSGRPTSSGQIATRNRPQPRAASTSNSWSLVIDWSVPILPAPASSARRLLTSRLYAISDITRASPASPPTSPSSSAPADLLAFSSGAYSSSSKTRRGRLVGVPKLGPARCSYRSSGGAVDVTPGDPEGSPRPSSARTCGCPLSGPAAASDVARARGAQRSPPSAGPAGMPSPVRRTYPVEASAGFGWRAGSSRSPTGRARPLRQSSPTSSSGAGLGPRRSRSMPDNCRRLSNSPSVMKAPRSRSKASNDSTTASHVSPTSSNPSLSW